jgi:hypothetical protein
MVDDSTSAKDRGLDQEEEEEEEGFMVVGCVYAHCV